MRVGCSIFCYLCIALWIIVYSFTYSDYPFWYLQLFWVHFKRDSVKLNISFKFKDIPRFFTSKI